MGKRRQRTTFCELRFKDVINICDGRRLGRVIDLVIDVSCSKVRGLIVPGERSFNIFRSPEEIFIPWSRILRIGEDVILVEMLNIERPRDKDDRCRDRNKRDRRGRACAVSATGKSESRSKESIEDEVKPKVLKYMAKLHGEDLEDEEIDDELEEKEEEGEDDDDGDDDDDKDE